MFPPDGLFTYAGCKHHVIDYDPRIATDIFDSDDYLDDCLPLDLSLVSTTEEPNMNTSEDEPSSGLNGRLRPRKLSVPSSQGKSKPESKPPLDRPKRTSTPSKVSPSRKQDDLATKSDSSPTSQFLCPYCDRKFASKQTASKHARRAHNSAPKQDTTINCLFCNHTDTESNIVRHMVDSHPNQYFACLDCHTRFPSTSELAEHKLNVCEKQKVTYRTKPRPKLARVTKKTKNIARKSTFAKHGKDFQEDHGFNGIVISCELKPPQDHDGADIEDNITTNLILPPSKNLGGNSVLEKNAVIVLDDIQWNKRMPPNFSFHNTDPDQILSRLGVVHKSPRTAEYTKKDWFKALDDATQKFERCFDTKFYSKVASNVQENLTKFLDGSFNFNPDPDSQIKTRKTKNNVAINTAEGFPILLASEQYSRSAFDGYLPRAIAPKHKWKWDNLENDRSLMTAAEIVKRDSHTNNCIITLVASLDIWTQLSMRRKFEEKFNVHPVEKKTEKQNILSRELKEILESREIPSSSSVSVVKRCGTRVAPRAAGELDFPAALGLVPAPPALEARPAVLSGEWVRPRCLVCCACGEHSADSKGLSGHIASRHPNANVQCYEIVGEPLLNADIVKHLYVPPSQVSNRTRPPRGFRECTKCNKSITLDDLHQHMLECAGDTPAVRRRQPRQRPFGVRRRRTRVPDNAIHKKIRKDIRSRQRRQKTHIGPRPRIRTEVGDAETIRKMLADLPAKRHRVLVNPMNLMQRPRRKLDMQRTKLILRKRSTEEMKNRKQRLKGTSDEKDGSSDDPNKNMSSLEDDEDNRPLKPKMKPVTKILRRREPLKRQAVVMSTAKRKSLRAAKRRLENAEKSIDVAVSADIQDNSLEAPQKIDIKKAPYNTREHAANRGASNNRDDQRPGCSGTNGSGDHSCAPTQSVPLKHSIARLTANSETHDKSVQFHHSFLVQQECNNTDQHVPTGPRTLFENEAVVSKLDKPPLNFCQRGFIDMQSLQKNKANKPRKGLNDCIAMLKNKLVDPVPNQATGYVSVQCGSDDPIDQDLPIVAKPIKDLTKTKDLTVNVNLQTENAKPLENKPQTRQNTTKKQQQSAVENILIQEKVKDVPQSTEKTTKTVNQKHETSEIKENTNLLQYKQETAYKIDQSTELLQVQKKDHAPLHRPEDVQKIKQSVENSQIIEKPNSIIQHKPDGFQKAKRNSESSQSSEKVHSTPHDKQEPAQSMQQASESAHIEAKKDNLVPKRQQESSQNVKHGENSYAMEKTNLLHQYRQDPNQKHKLSSEAQYQEKMGSMPYRQEMIQKLSKQYPEFLQLPDNLSVIPHYRSDMNQRFMQHPDGLQLLDRSNLVVHRPEAVHKLKQNPELIHYQDNLALLSQYGQDISQKLMPRPDVLHLQEKNNLGPPYRPDSLQKYKPNEVNSLLLQEKSAVHIDCDMTRSNSREVTPNRALNQVSPNVRSRRNSGHDQVSPQTRSRRDSSHSQVSPRSAMRSPHDYGQVSLQIQSRRNSGHNQVSPLMRSPQDFGHGQVSPQIQSRRNSGHNQVSPLMRSPQDFGHGHVSPQIQSRRNSDHNQVSPLMRSPQDFGHGQVSPQIQSRRNSGNSQVSPQMRSPQDFGHGQVSPQLQTRRNSGHNQINLEMRSPQEFGIGPSVRPCPDFSLSQLMSLQIQTFRNGGHSQVSPQIRPTHDYGHNQLAAETTLPLDGSHNQGLPVQLRRNSGHNQVTPRSRHDSGHGQMNPQISSSHDPAPNLVSPQMPSRHDVVPNLVKSQMPSRHDDAPNPVSSQMPSRHDAAPNLMKSQMPPRHDAASNLVSSQTPSRHEAVPNLVSSQMPSRHDPASNLASSQMPSRHDAAPNLMSSQMPSRHDAAPKVVSSQMTSRLEAVPSLMSSQMPSRHETAPNLVSSQMPSRHEQAPSLVSSQMPSRHDSGHSEMSRQIRSRNDSGHSEMTRQIKSHHDSTHNQVSAQIPSRHDPAHSLVAESIKELGKRQSTEVFKEKDTPKIDTHESTWQTPFDVHPEKSGAVLPSNKHSNSTLEHVMPNNSEIIRNNPDTILENNFNPPQNLHIFAEDSRNREIPTSIPPAHANIPPTPPAPSCIIVKTVNEDDPIPLDLSSKVFIPLHLPIEESYDDNGTLDLSNKNKPIEEDVVVDLSVKPSHSRNTPVTLDLCMKPGTSTNADIPSEEVIENYPTDLSIKGKETGLLYTTQNAAEQQLPTARSSVTPTNNDNIYSLENLEKRNETIEPNFVQEVQESNVESKDYTHSINKSDVFDPNYLSQNVSTKSTPSIEKRNTNMENKTSEIIASKTQTDTSQSNVNILAMQKQTYDSNPTLGTSHYKLRVVNETMIEDSKPTSETVPSSAQQDLNFTKISANSAEVLNPKTICSSVSPLTGAVTIHPIPGRKLAAPASKVESTTPVYTLANACISVTKIESSNASVLTNTLLSVPGSTIASTTPVYTLTGTTISTPNNDIANGSAKRTGVNESFVGPDSNIGANITNSLPNEKMRNDFSVDQDPETAKKIAMLPKELVDILGNMPIDHRNQLLNVLPQYVSTTVANCASSSGTNKNLKDTLEKAVASPTEKLASDKVSLDQKHSITYKAATSTPIYEISANKSQSVNDNIQSTSSPKCLKEETDVMETQNNMKVPSKPNLIDDKLYVKELPTENRIIDLTEDDHVPVTKVVDIPRVITIPQKDLPTSGETGMINIQKRNNDKTASLRAVRIKAPSLRQKEKQTLHQDSAEHVANNVYTEIQQVGNHSSKLNDKTTLGADSRVAAKLSPIDTSEHRIETTDKLLDLKEADVVKEKDEPKDDVVLKTKSSTSIRPMIDPNLPTKEQKDGNDKGQIVKNDPAVLIKGAISNDTKIEPKTTCNTDNNLKLVKNVDNNNIKKNMLVQENKYAQETEEDSEDDIILAAIVKQKHQSNTPRNKQGIKKKKKDKKTKNVFSKETIKVDTVEKPSHKTDPADNSIKVYDLQMNTNVLNNETEAKISPDTNQEKDNHKCKSDVKSNNEGSKPEASDSKVFSRDQDYNLVDSMKCSGKVESNLTKETQETKILEQMHVFSTTKTQEEPLVKPLTDLKQRDKPKKKKKNVDFNSPKDLVQEKTKDDTQVTTKAKLVDQDRIMDTEKQQSQVCNSVADGIHKQLKDSNKQEIFDLKTDVKKNSKVDRSKKYLSDFNNDDSIINELQDIENNIDAPLRRSRRGKSFYLDGNLPALETINMDIAVDQKGPLTKKQLIFSKLLDEEKQTKSLISKDEEMTSVTDNVLTPTIVPSDIISKTSKLGMDISTEKNKSVKRKKAPQIKRKSKKKKCGDDLKISDDDTLADYSESDIKNNSEKSAEVMVSVVPDNVPSVELMEFDIPKEKHPIETDSAKKCKSVDAISDNSKQPVGTMNVEDNISQSNSYTNRLNTGCVLEKRKISTVPSNADVDQNSKPKKTKFNKNKETELSEDLENETKLTGSNHEDTKSMSKPENFVTTCYDVPIAARRTRSKSFVIKSPNTELYDPYNIDLDEMIQKPEPLRKTKAKELKTKKNSSSKFRVSEVKEINNENSIQDDTVKQKSEQNKEETSPVSSKAESNSRKLKKSDSNKEVKPKKSFVAVADEMPTKLNSHGPKTAETTKDTISDSDESSKSDVPLKKYVEGKVKKLAAKSKTLALNVDNTEVHQNERKNDKSSGSKKKQRTINVSKDSESKKLSNEIEKDIRSEQFMESFGFFSERKPRKSNLLASKKISETFHIIASESEDYYSSRERSSRKTTHADARKSADRNNIQPSPAKKRGRKKKEVKEEEEIETVRSFCEVCRKEFRRPDNLLRHQMTLLHVAKLAEVEFNQKAFTIRKEPNPLIAFKYYLDRIRAQAAKTNKNKKSSRSKLKLPNLKDILSDVEKVIKGQKVRLPLPSLNNDQVLFLDSSKLLKESRHCSLYNLPGEAVQDDIPALPIRCAFPIGPNLPEMPSNAVTKGLAAAAALPALALPSTSSKTRKCTPRSSADLDFITKAKKGKSGTKGDDDVDSVSARSILESGEVKSLEKDLILGFKHAANEKRAKKTEYYANTTTIHPHEISSEDFPRSRQPVKPARLHGSSATVVGSDLNKTKKVPEYKEKMYPDIIEDIDMFEDKFDKIKRKCRSQAAAAKQVQSVAEPAPGHKGRKKIEKKKGKKTSKKSLHNTVLTKGALKGFDGIKVSIPTSDINMSGIVSSPQENTQKKKKKATLKKKKEKRDSESNSKHDSDHHVKESSHSQKRMDVYEFMDNDIDAELFEFRPSTLMERFKSISKETPSTSKREPIADEPDNSSESASDGDDFVYMSDDYVCSDDETENSSVSCEIGNAKNDTKKVIPLKRKDVVEKNAVMGKIFKHNAVRTEKKSVKSKETTKPKANLDQLFDSLLEEKPNSSNVKGSNSPKQEGIHSPKQQKCSPKYDRNVLDERRKAHKKSLSPEKFNASDATKTSPPFKNLEPEEEFSSKYDVAKRYKYGPSTSRQDYDIYGPSTSTSTGFDMAALVDRGGTSPKKNGSSSTKKHDISPKHRISPIPVGEHVEYRPMQTKKSPLDTLIEAAECAELEDAGVARHRARRKCTVGKQNVLAETWSSESEPDGLPPRPTSAESVVAGPGRKKKGRKRDGQQAVGRRGKAPLNKKHDIESRVTSNKWSTTGSSAASHSAAGNEGSSAGAGPSSERAGPSRERAGSSSERAGPSRERAGPSHERAGPSSEHAGPNRERAGPSSERAGPSRERAGPSHERAGPSSEHAGPSRESAGPSRERAGPSRERAGPSSERAGPSRERAGPSHERAGPSSERAGPSRERAGPSSERAGPSRERAGPSSERAGPSSERAGPSRERAGPSSDRDGPSCSRDMRPPPAPSTSSGSDDSSTSKARPRPAAYYWSSEGDEEPEPQQQHGWIVGNSHKRLVTMLAHAKGRKRNNDDKNKLGE